MFNVRKLATDIGIFTGLLTAGDVICQQLEMKHAAKVEKSEKDEDNESLQHNQWDRRRTANFMVTGIPIGTLAHFWYTYLDRRLPGTAARTIAIKIAGDQLLYTPAFYVTFFTANGLCEGKRLLECWQELKAKIIVLYFTDSLYWPPVQVINFYFIHPRLRVGYVAIATLVWNVFLSFAKTVQFDLQSVEQSIRKILSKKSLP